MQNKANQCVHFPPFPIFALIAIVTVAHLSRTKCNQAILHFLVPFIHVRADICSPKLIFSLFFSKDNLTKCILHHISKNESYRGSDCCFLSPGLLKHGVNCNIPLSGSQQLDSIHVTQLERDTVLVCLDSEYYFKVYFECTTS